MSDLAEFLLACIGEDEAAARAAIAPGQLHPWGDRTMPEVHPNQVPGEVRGYLGGTWGEHFARWDPARVLAEREAKRRILEIHKPYRRIYGLGCDVCLHPRRLTVDVDGWPCPTLRLLALPYADNPDYRQEWMP